MSTVGKRASDVFEHDAISNTICSDGAPGGTSPPSLRMSDRRHRPGIEMDQSWFVEGPRGGLPGVTWFDRLLFRLQDKFVGCESIITNKGQLWLPRGIVHAMARGLGTHQKCAPRPTRPPPASLQICADIGGVSCSYGSCASLWDAGCIAQD